MWGTKKFQSGAPPLTGCVVLEEVEGRRRAHLEWRGEIAGSVHHVGTKSRGECVDCHFQAASPSKRAEKIELNLIIDSDQVVSGHAHQAEGSGMIELVEEIDGN